MTPERGLKNIIRYHEERLGAPYPSAFVQQASEKAQAVYKEVHEQADEQSEKKIRRKSTIWEDVNESLAKSVPNDPELSQLFVDLVKKCLVVDPGNRSTMAQIVVDPFFKVPSSV